MNSNTAFPTSFYGDPGGGGGGTNSRSMNNSITSVSDQLNMSASYEKSTPDVGTMDDLQFNESLDALLESGNLSDGRGSPSNSNTDQQHQYSSIPRSITMQNHQRNHHQQQQQQQPMQGLLTAGDQPILPFVGGSYGTTTGITPLTSSNPSAFGGGMPQYSPFSMFPPGSQLVNTQKLEALSSSMDADSVTSSTGPRSSSRGSHTRSRKRVRDVSAVSEDEEERDRRRHDRNIREQQRSHMITHQIDNLKDVLAAANVPFKPDKYSTLVSVADFIKELQEKSARLDLEHTKLIETISRTNEIVNSQYVPASTTGKNPPGSSSLLGMDRMGNLKADEANDTVMPPNMEYKTIFERCGAPLAVLSVDGRFLECNYGFEQLSGYRREELLPAENLRRADSVISTPPFPQNSTMTPPPHSRDGAEAHSSVPKNLSLFNILSRENMEGVFKSMSEMLKQAPDKALDSSSESSVLQDYWSGTVSLSRNADCMMRMNLSLVRTPQGRAKFFNCSLSTETDATFAGPMGGLPSS